MRNKLLSALFIACGIALLCAPMMVFSDAMPKEDQDPLEPNPTPLVAPTAKPPETIDSLVKKGDALLYEYGNPEQKNTLSIEVLETTKDNYTVQYEFRTGDVVTKTSKEVVPMPAGNPAWLKDASKLKQVTYNTVTGKNNREQQLTCYLLPGKEPKTIYWMCEFVPLGGIVKVEQDGKVTLSLKSFKRAGD